MKLFKPRSELQAICHSQGWQFCFIGGVALQRWGEPRETVDVDLCSPEGLIVLKGFAGRGQDWVDVERIIVRQTGRLDWDYIREQLRPLAELKEMPAILDQLEHAGGSSSSSKHLVNEWTRRR